MHCVLSLSYSSYSSSPSSSSSSSFLLSFFRSFFRSFFPSSCLLAGYLERASAAKRSEAAAVRFSLLPIPLSLISEGFETLSRNQTSQHELCIQVRIDVLFPGSFYPHLSGFKRFR